MLSMFLSDANVQHMQRETNVEKPDQSLFCKTKSRMSTGY